MNDTNMRISKEEVENQIKSIIAESPSFSKELEGKGMDPHSEATRKIATDSLKALEFLLRIENKFQFKLNYEELDIGVFEDFTKCVDYIHMKLNDSQG